MKAEYVEKIIEAMEQCDDIALLDIIYQLLLKSGNHLRDK